MVHRHAGRVDEPRVMRGHHKTLIDLRPVHEAVSHRSRRDRYRRQVFGLVGTLAIGDVPTGRRFPGMRPVRVTAVVPTYRCGTAPDSHRIPSHPRSRSCATNGFDAARGTEGLHRDSRRANQLRVQHSAGRRRGDSPSLPTRLVPTEPGTASGVCLAWVIRARTVTAAHSDQ